MDYDYGIRRQSVLSKPISGDDLLIAAVIFLVFCIICLFIWISSPHLAPRMAARQQRRLEGQQFIWFMDDDIPEELEVTRGRGDIRERLYDDVEAEEAQARQDAGEVEPEAVLDTAERLKVAVEEHFQGMTAHADDGQNVHDQVIVKAHAIKYRRMLELRVKDPEHKEFVKRLVSQGYKAKDVREMETTQAFQEISAYVKDHVTDEGKRRRINTVLEEISRGATSISLTGRPVKDIWVLTLVWKRIHHQANESNMVDMRDILIDQLNDAATEARDLFHLGGVSTVCVGGRIGRIMSVLTRMDADQVLSKPEMDSKELTNEASMKCAQLIKGILEENPALAELYAKLTEDLNREQRREVEQFEERMRTRIDETLREDYGDLLSTRELDRLIQNMQAGV